MKKLLYISLLILFFTACEGDPIFYALENEEEIIDNNNFKETTPVSSIILYNDAGQNYYITHGKQLWYSIADSDEEPWETISLPSGYGSSSVVSSITEFGNRLYFVISNEDNDSKTGVYYIESIDGKVREVFDYKRFDESGDDYSFYELDLFSTDDELYISRITRDWSSQSSDSSSIDETELFHFASAPDSGTDLETGTEITLPGLEDSEYKVKSITDTGADSPGEIYLAVIEVGDDVDYYDNGLVYKADMATPTSFTEEVTGKDCSYNNIYYSENLDILVLSTRESGRNHSILYKLNNAGTWGAWQTDLEGGDDKQFTAFADISTMPNGDDVILVGTKGDVIDDSQSYYIGKGYYELNLEDTSSPYIQSNDFTSDSNYNSTDLKTSTINGLLYDSVNDKVYATTSSYGLWVNKADSDGDRDWYQE